MTRRIVILGLILLVGWCGGARGAERTENKENPFPWKMAVRVGGDWEMDLAEERSRYVAGAGYDLEFILPISRKFALTATYFKRGISYNEVQYWEDTAFTVTRSTVTYESAMYLLGLQYTDDDLLGIDFLDYFCSFKYGDLTQDLDGAIFLRENATGDRLRSAPYKREADQGMIFGIGFLWRLSERIGVDIGFQRILRIDRPAGAPQETNLGMWQTAAISAGIIFGLPEKE